MSLDINSLEDAFINIGMDVEKFLNPEIIDDDKKDKINDFSHIQVPECLKKPPVYSFFI